MFSTEFHCQGCPFWCQNAQNQTNRRGRHAKEAENLAFSRGKRWWNGLRLSQNNPSPLAHHFHWVPLPRFSQRYALSCKTRLFGPKVARFCEGVKKALQGATTRQVNKMHRRQSANVGLIISSPIRSAFSHYCWEQSGLPSLAPADNDLDNDLWISSVSSGAREGRPDLDSPAVAREGSPDHCQQEQDV